LPERPEGFGETLRYLNAQVRPFHAALGLAGFVMACIASIVVFATLAASLIYNSQVWAGRWHEIALIAAVMLAIDAFWFFVWRIYRRIARTNRMRKG
jgi:hypothetical protein